MRYGLGLWIRTTYQQMVQDRPPGSVQQDHLNMLKEELTLLVATAKNDRKSQWWGIDAVLLD